MRRSLLAVLLVLGACSSDSLPSGGPLLSALGHVSDTATTRAYVEFGRPKEAVQLNGGKAYNTSGAYSRVVGYGTGSLASYAAILPDKLGWDVLTADTALVAGEPPNQGGLLTGVKPDTAKLTALGATVSGSTYRFRPDHRIVTTDKLAQALPSLISLNVLRVSGSDSRWASATAGLDQVDASDHTLADNAAVREVASCLGDPLAAVLADTLPSARRSAAASSRTEGVEFVGVGAAKDAVETMCVRAGSDAQAKVIAAAVEKALAGRSQATNTPWSTLLSGTKVTRDGRTVKLTGTAADKRAGLLLQAFQRGDLPGVSG